MCWDNGFITTVWNHGTTLCAGAHQLKTTGVNRDTAVSYSIQKEGKNVKSFIIILNGE